MSYYKTSTAKASEKKITKENKKGGRQTHYSKGQSLHRFSERVGDNTTQSQTFSSMCHLRQAQRQPCPRASLSDTTPSFYTGDQCSDTESGYPWNHLPQAPCVSGEPLEGTQSQVTSGWASLTRAWSASRLRCWLCACLEQQLCRKSGWHATGTSLRAWLAFLPPYFCTKVSRRGSHVRCQHFPQDGFQRAHTHFDKCSSQDPEFFTLLQEMISSSAFLRSKVTIQPY